MAKKRAIVGTKQAIKSYRRHLKRSVAPAVTRDAARMRVMAERLRIGAEELDDATTDARRRASLLEMLETVERETLLSNSRTMCLGLVGRPSSPG